MRAELTVLAKITGTCARATGGRAIRRARSPPAACGLGQLLDQGLDRRAVAVDDHVILHLRRAARQTRLEAIPRGRGSGTSARSCRSAPRGELQNDDEDHHRRMVPARLVAVAGGGDGLGGEFESGPESRSSPSKVAHAQPVEAGGHQHGDRQQRDQEHETLPGLVHRQRFYSPR